MSKEPAKRCPHCNAKMVEYKHHLSKVLIRGLRKALAATDSLGRFDIASVDLTNAERQNLSKLKYFGIIAKQGDTEGHGGGWRITLLGMKFLRGEVSIQKTRRTYRDEVIEHIGGWVFITNITGGWKYRPTYVSEGRNHEPQQDNLF